MSSSKLQEIEFPNDLPWKTKVIIAMKGLPSTGKSEIGKLVGRWANCQVCYIDDFLDAFSLERGYTADSPPPSDEEVHRLHRLASEALYTAALRHLKLDDRVVIKSRLCSAFEIDLLIRLAYTCKRYSDVKIIIIDCEIKNEYRYRKHCLFVVYNIDELFFGEKKEDDKWYKARSWKDIEKAMDDDDFLDSQAWDRHLLQTPCPYRVTVTRLVVDFFEDLNVRPQRRLHRLTPDFLGAIKYLLKKNNSGLAHGYKAVQYAELRRHLLEIELGRRRERSKYVCTSTTSKAASCVFKYHEALPAGGDECGACGKGLVSGEAAYTCHFCILTLHKSCAQQNLDFNVLKRILDFPDGQNYVYYYDEELFDQLREKHACMSCIEQGKHFSLECESCLIEKHLKCGTLPTIINHDCHPLHFLSLQLSSESYASCKACEYGTYGGGRYVCHICNFFYHFKCVFMPREVKHEHGGYEHVMKLMYTHDGMDHEDDHWCNVCYKEMNPQNWFYACQDCPYYVTHALPVCVGEARVHEAISTDGNLLIQQTADKLKVDE